MPKVLEQDTLTKIQQTIDIEVLKALDGIVREEQERLIRVRAAIRERLSKLYYDNSNTLGRITKGTVKL